MASKIFISYRRDDDPSAAARVRDGLAAAFGKASLFMDVDNLFAGQRFDEELAKALATCDVLIVAIGANWMDLLKARIASGERDYVREEIAEALRRKLVAIPVRVGREGRLAPLPQPDELPADIRDLVLYQKHDVTHERFGRDIAELIEAITFVRRSKRSGSVVPQVPWGWIGASAASALTLAYVGAYFAGMPIWWPMSAPAQPPVITASTTPVKAVRDIKAEEDRRLAATMAKRNAEEAERVRLAMEQERQRAIEAKRNAEETERRLKAEQDRQRAAAEAKQKADEAERQRLKTEEERLERLRAVGAAAPKPKAEDSSFARNPHSSSAD